MKLTITCTSDQKYIKFLRPLINSIHQNTTNTKMFVRLVNVDPVVGDDLLKLHSDIQLMYDNQTLCEERNLLCGNNDTMSLLSEGGARYGYLVSEHMCYCSNIKYNTINKLLESGSGPILHMDVDAIVRRDLLDLYDLISEHDIIIRKDRTNDIRRNVSEPNGETYRQGVIGINNTPITCKVFHEIEQRVNLDMYNWDADQINFYHVFEENKNNIRFMNLPISYRDTCHDHLGGNGTGGGFFNDSYIWSGSYKAKYTQQKYLNEFVKYK